MGKVLGGARKRLWPGLAQGRRARFRSQFHSLGKKRYREKNPLATRFASGEIIMSRSRKNRRTRTQRGKCRNGPFRPIGKKSLGETGEGPSP